MSMKEINIAHSTTSRFFGITSARFINSGDENKFETRISGRVERYPSLEIAENELEAQAKRSMVLAGMGIGVVIFQALQFLSGEDPAVKALLATAGAIIALKGLYENRRREQLLDDIYSCKFAWLDKKEEREELINRSTLIDVPIHPAVENYPFSRN